MPAADSLRAGALPIGLAHRVALRRGVTKGSVLTWDDVVAMDGPAVQVRREMERQFTPAR
jgi:predicted homoserine dehydrogenase-like protein